MGAARRGSSRSRPEREPRGAHSARCYAWRERGRFPSVARERFAAELAREGARLDISGARVADVPVTDTIVLWLGGMLRPEQEWREIRVEARRIEFVEAGRSLERRTFIALGEAYWDAWAERTPGAAD